MAGSRPLRQQFRMTGFQHWNNDEWRWRRFRAAPLGFHTMVAIGVLGSAAVLGWLVLLMVHG